MDIINISQTFMNTREREKIGNGEAYGVFTLNKKIASGLTCIAR